MAVFYDDAIRTWYAEAGVKGKGNGTSHPSRIWLRTCRKEESCASTVVQWAEDDLVIDLCAAPLHQVLSVHLRCCLGP